MPIEIVMIVVASMIFTLILIKMIGDQKKAERAPNIQQAELDALKERVRVLERITVDEGNSLATEIERLRDPNSLPAPSIDDLGQLEPAKDKSTTRR